MRIYELSEAQINCLPLLSNPTVKEIQDFFEAGGVCIGSKYFTVTGEKNDLRCFIDWKERIDRMHMMPESFDEWRDRQHALLMKRME